MPDPDTVAIPVLAGAALAQGITFLYGQAAEVLRIRRQEKAAQRTTLTLPDVFEPLGIDVIPDLAVLQARASELEALLSIAEVFTPRAAKNLDGTDLALRTCFGRLRDVLEAVYGTHFTFSGESRRERRVRQSIDDVRGTAMGMKVRGSSAAANAAGDVVQRVQTVHEGGELTGIDIDLRD